MSGLNQISEMEEKLWQVDETNVELPVDVYAPSFRTSFEKQMNAFRMLSAGAIERFSRESFYRMLLCITRKKHPIESIRPSREDTLSYIKSLEQLRRQVTSLKRTKRRILYSADEIQRIGRYFNVFFDDLEYLRDLKSYFDERILKFIVEVSNEAALTLLSRQKTGPGAGGRVGAVSHLDTGRGARGASSSSDTWLSKLKMTNGKSKNSLELSAKREMKNITHLVNTLRCLEIKWANVLREEDIDFENYEVETRKVMIKQRDRPCFELIWYLIPDLFAKASKAVKLSRQWLLKITSYYDILMSADIKKKTKTILAKIAEIDRNISLDEEKMKVLEVEMKRLSLKEHRHNLLTKDYNSTKDKIDRASSSYHKTQLEQKTLNRKLQDSSSLTPEEIDNLTAKLEQAKWKISTCQTELKIQKFNLSLLQQDLILEADMRSTFIRFQETVKEMLLDLNVKVESKKETKRKLEKEIALLKANKRKAQGVFHDEHLSDVAERNGQHSEHPNQSNGVNHDEADDNNDNNKPNDYFNEDEGDEDYDDGGNDGEDDYCSDSGENDTGDGEISEDIESESETLVQITERLNSPTVGFDKYTPNVFLYTNGAKDFKQTNSRRYKKTVTKVPNDSDIYITLEDRDLDNLTSYITNKSYSSDTTKKKSRIPRLKAD